MIYSITMWGSTDFDVDGNVRCKESTISPTLRTGLIIIIIIRPHRMHALHRCGCMVTHGACSMVCLSVCVLGHDCAVQKRLNRSWARVGADLGPRNHVLDGGHGRGKFGVVWSVEKQWESLLQCIQQWGHLIPSNGMLRDCCSRLQCFQLVGVALYCTLWKTASRNAAFCRNSLITLFYLSSFLFY